MHAIVIDPQKNLVWKEVPEPSPKPGDVLIDVHAAALNRADLMQRAGKYPPPPGWPEWPGLEAAGTVISAPAQSRWQPGDRVCALLGGGGYAQRVAVPEELVLPVPDGLDMVAAAALPEVFATACVNLVMEAGMQAGDTVFIQAGASGLGMAAIQMVKYVGGTVITTVGSEEKAAFVRGLGADVVVNHRTQDVAAALRDHPANIALDCVGGEGMGKCLATMAPGGRWIMIATLGGAKTEIDLNTFFRHGLRLIGSTLRSRPLTEKARILAALEERFWPALASGAIRPIIHATLPITQAGEAHAILERRENLGKVVLTIKDA